jgi:hypothetical protein
VLSPPDFVVYARPDGRPLALTLAPQLESCERKDHPSQVRLGQWLAHVCERLALPSSAEDLALDLTVGFQRSRPLTGSGRDLDNFVLPVVRHLGPHRFACAWTSTARGLRLGHGDAVPSTGIVKRMREKLGSVYRERPGDPILVIGARSTGRLTRFLSDRRGGAGSAHRDDSPIYGRRP